MEIGSLAEWATAVAETAAVLVALFLPYFERRRADRKSTRNLKIMLQGIVRRAVADNDPKSLETFINVSSFTDAGERDKETLDVARQILELFKSDNADIERRNREIDSLLDEIRP
ncbi:hypothetical protein OZX62_04210 [Bifidobacterium sp. ESL0690]|uniref:hypothetical protein n=1 Tax=Bifidobacterium sp. ESL0690 TaxID=2983214 RepID=UPI0023FA2608|nr:hypothetical protein [Bifidobacterium sp. ESL0690]WEV47479.1 hypothetical protein OZX62_04210 [Bifidobacterium sp. ESL0690]